MLIQFQNHIQNKFPFLKESRFCIAISGGVDSMVLAHLFQQLQYSFSVLHCNFQLRGEESDGDEQFVTQYFQTNRIPVKVKHFVTEEYAKQYKQTIQVAARELRYHWFQEEMQAQDIQYLVTAHHADDDLETFIINLSRGCGLDGLIAIPEVNDAILRPLLPFSRQEILEYAKENNIEWREDSSNASDKYLRNKIRHHIVPLLKELHPAFLDNFIKTQDYLKQTQAVIQETTANTITDLTVINEDETVSMAVKNIKKLPNYQLFLYQWLKDFGFTAWQDIYNLVDAETGKRIVSPTHILLKNREYLMLSVWNEEKKEAHSIAEGQNSLKVPLKLTLDPVEHIAHFNNNTIFVDADKLSFPLIIRKREEADAFFPSGMKGKKKLSKYFKDEKYSLFDKENQWLLVSATNEIIWVIGKRADERFVAHSDTLKILKIELEQ